MFHHVHAISHFASGSKIANRCIDGSQDGWPGFDSRQRQEIFLYSTAFTPASKRIESLIQLAPKAVSQGTKGPWLEADCSSLSSAGVKNCRDIHVPLLPHTYPWCIINNYSQDLLYILPLTFTKYNGCRHFCPLGAKQQGREIHYLPPSSTEVKNSGAVPPIPVCLHDRMLNRIVTC
jgi:hypothetical protein